MKRLLVGLTLAAGCAGSEAPTKTEILWDTWGVPHIYATNDVEAFKAFGYAPGGGPRQSRPQAVR